MPRKPPEELNDRESRFCEHLVEGMTTKAAWRGAGFPKNPTHSEVDALLQKPEIQRYLTRLRHNAARRADLNADFIILGFLDAINDAKMAGDPRTMVQGYSEIGKMLGFYAPKKAEIELGAKTQDLLSKMANMSTQELAKLAGPDTNAIDADWFEEI